jgi:small-conductance mechanosensitive channel
MGQTQISNFSTKSRAITRSHIFRVPYGTPIDVVKRTLMLSALSVIGVKKEPTPVVQLSEAAESWMTFKLYYFIDDYGAQWGVADRVLTTSMAALAKAGIELAAPKLQIVEESELQPAN